MAQGTVEALGFIMLWGYTPAVDAFKGTDIDVSKDDKDINLLFSETGGDARHVLKTIADLLPLKTARKNKINIYYHEKNKENLARLVLFLTLICETGIARRERMEMFLDLYANSLLREKTAQYLEEITHELI
jgi:hypothetical protein